MKSPLDAPPSPPHCTTWGGISTFIFILGLLGCAPATRIPLPPPPTVPVPSTVSIPQFEKTFGSISSGQAASLVIRYKTMTLVVDPQMDGAQSAALLPQTDYVLLTDAQPHHFSDAVRSTARKNIKIIASTGEAERIKSDGFTEVKAVTGGQRIMLKKDNSFVFVSASMSQNPLSKRQVNSYLLEFENGRNIFISGEVFTPDALREFLYSLRDDGKEIYAGLFYRQAEQKEETLAQVISLIQPNNALLLQSDIPGQTKLDEATLRGALLTELYEKPLMVLKNGSEVPF